MHGGLGVKSDVADGGGLEARDHQRPVVAGLDRPAGGLEAGEHGLGHGGPQPDHAGRALGQVVNRGVGDEVALADHDHA